MGWRLGTRRPAPRRCGGAVLLGLLLGTAARSAPLDVEGEALVASRRVLVGGGRVAAQPMAGFGAGWSGDAQLFWSGGAVGAVLDLIDVPAPGTYAVELALTRAPDYGQGRIQVNGQDVPAVADGYAPRVLAPTPVPLGTFRLAPGQREVSLMIVGKNPQATGYLVGIDRVRLSPAGAP